MVCLKTLCAGHHRTLGINSNLHYTGDYSAVVFTAWYFLIWWQQAKKSASIFLFLCNLVIFDLRMYKFDVVSYWHRRKQVWKHLSAIFKRNLIMVLFYSSCQIFVSWCCILKVAQTLMVVSYSNEISCIAHLKGGVVFWQKLSTSCLIDGGSF